MYLMTTYLPEIRYLKHAAQSQVHSAYSMNVNLVWKMQSQPQNSRDSSARPAPPLEPHIPPIIPHCPPIQRHQTSGVAHLISHPSSSAFPCKEEKNLFSLTLLGSLSEGTRMTKDRKKKNRSILNMQ
jgi:hypothetical protein